MEVKQIKKTRVFSFWWWLLAFLFILIAIPAIALTIWVRWAFSPVDKNGSEVVFVIQENESVNSIANRLKEKGLIHDVFAFRFFTRFSCKGVSLGDITSILRHYPVEECLVGNLQAGSFKLSPKMSLSEVAVNLTKGRLDSWTKIVEGLRDEEVAAVLAKNYPIKESDFLEVAKEGYMFPDTYLFSMTSKVVDIAQKMRQTFDQKLTPQLQQAIKAQGLTVDEGVILASILERESRNSAERPIIAGIFYNRLRSGWKLEADATVQYALGYSAEEKTWWKKSLTYKDLQIDSPYNTRKYAGLPPKPICNPGLSALEAIAAPAKTDYFFYLHDSQGRVHFARTLEEHNQNKANYL